VAAPDIDNSGGFGAAVLLKFIVFSLSRRGGRVQPSHTAWFTQCVFIQGVPRRLFGDPARPAVL